MEMNAVAATSLLNTYMLTLATFLGFNIVAVSIFFQNYTRLRREKAVYEISPLQKRMYTNGKFCWGVAMGVIFFYSVLMYGINHLVLPEELIDNVLYFALIAFGISLAWLSFYTVQLVFPDYLELASRAYLDGHLNDAIICAEKYLSMPKFKIGTKNPLKRQWRNVLMSEAFTTIGNSRLKLAEQSPMKDQRDYEYKEAIKSFRKAVELTKEGYTSCWIGMTRAYIYFKDIENARECLNKAKEVDKYNVYAKEISQLEEELKQISQ